MIREYTKEDLVNTAKVWLRSGLIEYTYLPEFQKLNEPTAIDVFQRTIHERCKIWVFETNDLIVGFLAMKDDLADRLYVDPEYQTRGIGSSLIVHAKDLCPNGLKLRTHQQNKRACLFYERHGFKAVCYGLSPPPESMPDVEYYWSPNFR